AAAVLPAAGRNLLRRSSTTAPRGSQRPQALPPWPKRRPGRGGAGLAAKEATGSHAGPLRILIGVALREGSGPETAHGDGSGCLGPLRARRQLIAMKQLNGAARLPTPSSFASFALKKAQPERRRPLLRKKQQAAGPGPYEYSSA